MLPDVEKDIHLTLICSEIKVKIQVKFIYNRHCFKAALQKIMRILYIMS